MLRISKILVLAGLALMGVSGVASSAQADPMFHIEGWPTTLEGSHEGGNLFTVDGQNVNCNTANVKANAASETTNTLTVIHLWSSCTAFGFAGATINPGSCHTIWHLVNGETANVDVVCTKEGDAITINSKVFGSECNVKIGAQTGLAHIIFFNQTTGGKMEIIAEQTVNKAAANVTADNGLCPLSGTGARNNVALNDRWPIPGATVS